MRSLAYNSICACPSCREEIAKAERHKWLVNDQHLFCCPGCGATFRGKDFIYPLAEAAVKQEILEKWESDMERLEKRLALAQLEEQAKVVDEHFSMPHEEFKEMEGNVATIYGRDSTEFNDLIGWLKADSISKLVREIESDPDSVRTTWPTVWSFYVKAKAGVGTPRP
jgi:hypothetical protein